MAFNQAPTSIFPGYASDGTNITIPIADLPALTTVEAHASTGDVREVLRSILLQATTVIAALPTADKPSKMTITASNPQALSAEQQRHTYTAAFTVNVDPSTAAMAPEA